MAGRPSAYSDELADAICELLAEGKSLLSICKAAAMPSESTVRAWALDDREGFSAKYARARDIGLDHHGDDILEIADTATDANLARLKIDARKWYLSKLAPKKYGDKIAHVGGDEGDAPIALSVIERRIVNAGDRDG